MDVDHGEKSILESTETTQMSLAAAFANTQKSDWTLDWDTISTM